MGLGFKKTVVSHATLTALILVLVVYLVISVNHLHSSTCPSLFSFSPEHAAPETARISAAQTRRSRPMPTCAATNHRAKSFLMVFMGHSGSTAIISELSSNSRAYVHKKEPVDHQETFNTTAALLFTRDFFEKGIAEGKTPGFKIRPAHILTEPEQWRKLALDYDTRIIWQYRQNLFKSAVGEYSGRYLNDTSIVKGLDSKEQAANRCSFGVGCSYPIDDVPFFHELLRGKVISQRKIAAAVHAVTGGMGCVRELPYEDYLYEREETLADVFRFLGLPQEPSEPERFKATGDNMCSVVENWAELCQNYYGCALWQHMLDDPKNGCTCPLTSTPTTYCQLYPGE